MHQAGTSERAGVATNTSFHPGSREDLDGFHRGAPGKLLN